MSLSSLHAPETWTDFMYLRKTNREVIPNKMCKEGLDSFLNERGLPHSEILRKFDCAENLSLAALPSSFVLKPSNLWSAKGVMLLHRIVDTNLFFNAMTGKAHTESAIRDDLIKLQEENGSDQLRLIIENRVIDEDNSYLIPLDYKFYTFNGEIKLVVQINRNHKKPKLAFFDANFDPIDDDRVYLSPPKNDLYDDPRRPQRYNELIKLAQDLSKHLRIPFISIDCFASQVGPVVGEITYTPGGPWLGSMFRFSESFDRELGRTWADACQQLNIDIPLVEKSYEIYHKGKLYRSVPESGKEQKVRYGWRSWFKRSS